MDLRPFCLPSPRKCGLAVQCPHKVAGGGVDGIWILLLVFDDEDMAVPVEGVGAAGNVGVGKRHRRTTMRWSGNRRTGYGIVSSARPRAIGICGRVSSRS